MTTKPTTPNPSAPEIPPVVDAEAPGMEIESTEAAPSNEPEPALRRRRAAPLTREEAVDRLAGEIGQTVQKLVRDNANVADMRLLNAALKELRYAFRVFAPFRAVRKVSTFGSARTPPGHPVYRHAQEFAARLADLGYMIITGAGPGVMRACNEGSGRGRSFGINIRLPFEQQANEFIHRDPKLVNFKYFFTRKLLFVKEADAIALFPGGFGTHDEGFESLTLVQTGKSRPVPIVFIDAPGGTYWRNWKQYVEDHLLAEGLVSPADMRLFKVTDDLDEAIAEITGFYRRYHSSRYVGDLLVIRMNTRLSAESVALLDAEYADIVVRGGIRASAALPEEAGEPAIAELPRLVLHFARRHFGRLRMLIDSINALEPGSPVE